MLATPIGLNRSVDHHNVNFNAFCDWIEGSVLFDQNEVSGAEIVDILLEDGIYSKQDFAWEIVDNAWREIARRQAWIGAPAIEEHEASLLPTTHWSEQPALSFCLIASYARWYPQWARALGADFTEQGEIFETLVKESLNLIFPRWEIYHTGWTRTEPNNLDVIVKEVVSRLRELEGRLEPWTTVKANDAGLDLLCYRPFTDCRVGVPVLMMQCASGANWEEKLHTPNLNIWTKLISFASRPKKAFSTPYALSEADFMRNTNAANAVFFDRYRLLVPGQDNPAWVSVVLRDRINAWLTPRVAALPRLE